MGRNLLVVVSCCAAFAVLMVAGPSSGETCVRSVDAGSPAVSPEADLAAALIAANGTGCADWRIELTGTFPLTQSLEWDEPIPLHLIGPAGTTARIEGVGTDHRLLTLGLNAAGAAMTLERLVLAGGDVSAVAIAGDDEGGAILAGVLSLIDVELNGNSAVIGGAVSTVDLFATRTSFIGNSADLSFGDGGAVYAFGEVSLTNVTFADNVAKSGGAISIDGRQGGASLTATNVTFRGNEADDATGGAHLHLAGNAADLAVTMRGVLLGAVGGDSNGPSCAGSWFTATPAITSEASLAFETGCGVTVDAAVATLTYDTVPFLTGTTDLVLPSGAWAGLDAYACDPTNGWPTTDQRGLARPQGAAGLCDVGAVERVYVAPAPPPPPAPSPTPEPEPAATTEGPVPTSVPAGGGGCADGCLPSASDGSGSVTVRSGGVPVPPR